MTPSAICAATAFFAIPSTGKERDAESGNDYFGARYYASSIGRWMSPDWSAKEELVPYAKLDDPQSLNLYSFVHNNPLSRTDPDGHTDPTQKEIIAEVNRFADQYGVPQPIMHAVVKTESGFNIHEINKNRNAKGQVTSTDCGLFQVNSQNRVAGDSAP
jgi:RHS repeat-associated protein